MARKIDTQTKQDVVNMLVHGHTTQEIVDRLHVSMSTVQSIRRTYRVEIDRYSGTDRNAKITRGSRRCRYRSGWTSTYKRNTAEEVRKLNAVREIMSIIMG